jgi:hypothetical protein
VWNTEAIKAEMPPPKNKYANLMRFVDSILSAKRLLQIIDQNSRIGSREFPKNDAAKLLSFNLKGESEIEQDANSRVGREKITRSPERESDNRYKAQRLMRGDH